MTVCASTINNFHSGIENEIIDFAENENIGFIDFPNLARAWKDNPSSEIIPSSKYGFDFSYTDFPSRYQQTVNDNCLPDRRKWSEPIPDRQNFGQYLGIFGLAAGWVLGTESMPLALITGLIGFGLFGALVSSYIRYDKNSSKYPNIVGLLCRGVSAAMIVFLAAYGGLAVLTENSADPNPYVVFATCLVGAVFGENVWEWAKSKFLPNGGEVSTPNAGTQSEL